MSVAVHRLPFEIKYNGEAPVDGFFLVRSIEGANAANERVEVSKESEVCSFGEPPRDIPVAAENCTAHHDTSGAPERQLFAASFRGRGLKGVNVNIPDGYTGALLKQANGGSTQVQSDGDVEAEADFNNRWKIDMRFQSLKTWGYDEEPTAGTDPLLRALSWLGPLHDAVTANEDIERSIRLLRAYHFSIERAVQAFFDGTPIPEDGNSDEDNGHSNEEIDHGFDGVSASSTTRRRQPYVAGDEGSGPATSTNKQQPSGSLSPSVPPASDATSSQPSGPVMQRTLLQRLSFLTYPFTLGLHVAWAIFSFTVSLLPFNIFQRPRRRSGSARRRNTQSSDPQAAAARFLIEFEQQYGSAHPDFFQGTYSQALDVAKRELRYLLVILQSSEHDDTETFNRQTLTSQRLLNFLGQRNFLVWAGDIRESESFLVSNVLLATRYPFTALIAPQGSRMVVVDRIEGLVSAERLVSTLGHHANRFDSNLHAIRADRERQDQARSIREQQDQAYQASLRADQEKERLAKEERERALRAKEEEERKEQERVNKIEIKKRNKQLLAENLLPEPPISEAQVAKISIRLPNGERLVRRFRASDKLEILYNFVESKNLDPIPIEADIVILNTYPRKVLLDRGQSISEAGLFPTSSLIVEESDEDLK